MIAIAIIVVTCISNFLLVSLPPSRNHSGAAYHVKRFGMNCDFFSCSSFHRLKMESSLWKMVHRNLRQV